jgi:hypothetical protein
MLSAGVGQAIKSEAWDCVRIGDLAQELSERPATFGLRIERNDKKGQMGSHLEEQG